MKLLAQFTAPDVPQMAPTESEAPHNWKENPIPKGLPGKGMAQHPMLFFGEGYNKLMIVNKGKIIWSYQTGGGWEYDDAWMLSNGNILFTRMQYIAEINPGKKVVWRYDAPEGTEIHACQPIGQDKVLFILNGLPPKLMVVNIKTNVVEVEHALPLPGMDHRWVHGEFRRVRYTAQGTYLVPFLEMNRVVEYDKDFNEIWSYDVPTPWAAIRLKNGNTLITDEHDVTTFEVTPDKKIVWQIRRPTYPPSTATRIRSRPPGLRTATPFCVRAAAATRGRSLWKSHATRRWFGCCRTGRTLVRQRPSRSSTIPAFRKILETRNTEAMRPASDCRDLPPNPSAAAAPSAGFT